MIRCSILFDNLGPYHVARLRAAAEVVDLIAIQGGVSSSTYAWKSSAGYPFSCITINPDGPTEALSARDFVRRLEQALSNSAPEVVFVPGWASLLALAAMRWSIRNRVPFVVMSESTPWDEERVSWKEAIKKRLLRNAAGALVGGSAHRDYLIQLGMSPQSIFDGYDVVDNDYFEQTVSRIREDDKNSRLKTRDFFLASNRFVEKKNLFRLIDAYSLHCSRREDPWKLCLLGDGPLKSKLITHCQSLGLAVSFSTPWELTEELQLQSKSKGLVHFPGFRQIEDLPYFYARAKIFVHVSTTEQWGLVVNEAMAAGLPTIVSNRCGCADDLIVEGKTGWQVDPKNVEAISYLLTKTQQLSFAELLQLDDRVRSTIQEWSPNRFGSNVLNGATFARSQPIVSRYSQGSLLLGVINLSAKLR